MKVAIVPIGNSRGVRLPKALLDQCRFTDSAELTVEAGRIVLAPATKPRAGWAEAFGADRAHSAEDSEWIEAPIDDDSDWEWPSDSKSGS
jgi:antitoxin MazE